MGANPSKNDALFYVDVNHTKHRNEATSCSSRVEVRFSQDRSPYSALSKVVNAHGMGCYDVFCTLCGGPLNTGTIWDSLRSPEPQPGGMYWDYNQNLLCDEDLEVRVVLFPPHFPYRLLLLCFAYLARCNTTLGPDSLISAKWLPDVRIIGEWQSR